MNQSHPQVSLEQLCDLFGMTRQAFHEAATQERKTSIAHIGVLELVSDLRQDMPLLGIGKLFHLLQHQLDSHQVKMGRNHLFDLLGFNGPLICRPKRMVKTTDSHQWLKKYPNLIKELMVDGPKQLWVSDLTYIQTGQGFSYLGLITDAHSLKVVGYALYPTLVAIGCGFALRMALKGQKRLTGYTLIHDSDRGIQHCSAQYISLMENEQIVVSMTQSDSPYDNALAERVNGIIKNEFFSQTIYPNHQEAELAISRAISRCNTLRLHSSLGYLTPEVAHERSGLLKKGWKQYRKPRSVRQAAGKSQ